MANDKIIGAFLLLGSIILLLTYFWLVLGSYWWLAIEVVGTSAVIGVLGIIGWIGWTLATTPPPLPIDDTSPQNASETEAGKEQAAKGKK